MLDLSDDEIAAFARARRSGAAWAIVAACALAACVLAPGVARADHTMGMSGHRHHDASVVSLGLSFEAADYDNEFFTGSYQGVAPSLAWMHGRFGAQATVGLYHLTENGLTRYGAGDVMVAGHAAVVTGEEAEAGVALHVMAPTGDERAFGMGHVMAMPSLWATWRPGSFAVMASAGYSRALTSLGGAHQHGWMPLVDPMNPQELTWSAGGQLAVHQALRVGGRAFGAVPIGTGITRVIGAGRVAWETERTSTGLELQLGLAGDPFELRGVVDTALRF
jgi:hypothetical protein